MKLTDFIPAKQLRLIRQLEKGEEGALFTAKLAEVQAVIDSMPEIYGQDGKGREAIIYLHYFGGCFDGWVTEKDIDSEEGQIQAFGYASFAGKDNAECGYLGIKEYISTPGIELDLYWTPKTVREVLGE